MSLSENLCCYSGSFSSKLLAAPGSSVSVYSHLFLYREAVYRIFAYSGRCSQIWEYLYGSTGISLYYGNPINSQEILVWSGISSCKLTIQIGV